MMYPVIVVPGITAISLRNEYQVEPEQVWSFMRTALSGIHMSDQIALHPDNLHYEQNEPSRVMPDHIFSTIYNEFIKELRVELGSDEEECPVYPFAFDWRQPLEDIEDALNAFINEVIERTKLIKRYHKNKSFMNSPKVNLVGHSMGGVIIAGYLKRYGADAKVGKIASLGSPFRGSIEAINNLVAGGGVLAYLGMGERKRHIARLTPSLYYLLPSFDNAVLGRNNESIGNGIFDASNWQPNVVNDIKATYKKHGLKKLNASELATHAEKLFQGMLDRARAHRDRLEELSLEDVGLNSKDWLCIAGIGEDTRTHTKITQKQMFDLNTAKGDGDGTVPFGGACANDKFIPETQIVCVKDDDFDWEWKDSILESGAGLHAVLPLMSLVQKLVISHFQGKARYGAFGRPSPNLQDPENWDPPIKIWKMQTQASKKHNTSHSQ